MKNRTFELGKFYSREQISDAVGGERQTYLPQKRNQIVCGCFKLSTNPQAPREILPGNDPKVLNKAQLFCKQVDPVPVFMKRAPAKWEYVGEYVVESCDDSPVLLKQKSKESGRTNIAMVIYLKRAKG